MAGFVERISVLIDVKTGQAASALRSFKADIAAAEGFTGKMKVAGNQLGNTLGNLGTSIPLIGGYLAGVAKVSMDAADEFTGLAKASLDLSKATGLTVEQASRWIAVADDYQVSAADLATGLSKITKTLDESKWEKYGIDTRNAAGEARPANDILLDTFDALSKITNETERSRVGQLLLGKGYKTLAPLVGQTREEYEAMLRAVSKGQTITEKEAKKAEEWRLAQDKLADAMRDVQLAVGQLVVQIAPLIEGFADLAAAGGDKLSSAFETAENNINRVKEASLTLKDTLFTMPWEGEEEAVKLVAEGYGAMTDATNTARSSMFKQAKQVRDTVSALEELQGILNALNEEEAALDLADQFAATKQASDEAFYAVMAGAEDADAKLNDAQQSVIDLKREIIDYATKVAQLPPSKVTQIIALIDEGKLAEADALLKRLTATRTAYVVPVVGSGGGNTGSITPVNPGVGGSHIQSVGGTRGGGIVMNLTFNGVTNKQEIIDLITAAFKDGMKAPWMAA